MRNLRLLLLLLAVSSCKMQNQIDEIGLFEYPDNAWMIVGDSIRHQDAFDLKIPALCYWLDSTKCTPCEYDMLYNFEPYFNLADDVSFFVIVSPPSIHKNQIDYKTTINAFSFPIIVDMDCSLYGKNRPVGLGENDYAYIFLDEEGMGYEYVLSGEQMVYDIHQVFDYCLTNHR